MEQVHLDSIQLYSILSAIFWLSLGVVCMWYGNRMSVQQHQATGKTVSFLGLVMFVNAALVVYIPDLLLAWIIAGGLLLISAVILWIYQRKQKGV